MILLDEKYKGITSYKDHHAQLFWTYDFSKDDSKTLDFFLKSCLLWQNVISDAYQLKIGEDTVWMPFNYYFLLGDFDSGLDCISPQEIMNRPFQAVTFADNLEESTMILKDINIVGYEENRTFVIPYERGIFPVLVGKRVILISGKDFYNKIKDTTLAGMI
jgi:hypothetical protein